VPALEPDVVQQSRHASRKQAELAKIQYDAFVEQGFSEEMVHDLMQTWWSISLSMAHNAMTASHMADAMSKLGEALNPPDD
jgi:hypothetical protein